MTTTAKFPTAVMVLADVGGDVVNFGELVLNTTVTSGSTSIVSTSAIPAGWPQVGFITMDTEVIKHTSWTASTFTTVAAPNGRGFDGTTAASHTAGVAIKMADTALRFNQVVADVIALEQTVKSMHSVVAYGAAGDGAADDTSEIQAAITGAGIGGFVYLPVGKYKITGTLTPLDGQTIVGSGRRLRNAGSGGTQISYTGSGHAIDLTNVTSVTLRDFNIEINSPALSAIRMNDPVNRCSIDHIIIEGYGTTTGSGILGVGQVSSVSTNSITLCEFWDLARGIRFSGVSNANYIENCVFAVCGTAIDCSAVAPDTIGGGTNVFIRCEIDGSTTLGINIDNGDENTFIQCNTDGTTNSLTISATADRTTFVGCGFAQAPSDSSTSSKFISCRTSSATEFNQMRRTKSIWIPAQSFTVSSGSAALAMQGANTRYSAWAFDAAGNEAVSTSFALPIDYLTGNLTVKLYWTNLGAGSGNVVWRLIAKSFADAADLNSTAGEVNGDTTVAAPAQNILKVSTHGQTPVGSSNIFAISIFRQGADGADTLGNDAGLLGLGIEYTADWR